MNRKLLRSARGDLPIDLAIENIQLVNVFTGEVYPAAIGIVDGVIVHVTTPGETTLEARERYDGQGRYAIPGLIDTHLHIESSLLTPEHYAQVVLPHGTTTIVADPHEIGNILGEEGVRYMLEAARGLDLRILNLLPSCVPSAPNVETGGADFTPALVERMLEWEDIHGLAEVMNYHGVIHEDERMVKILEANERAGKLVQGHAPRVSGRDLSAYLIAGPNSDHESRTGDEALEKLRAGMIVEIRESSFLKDMAECAKVIAEKGYLPNVCLCSDDVVVHDLLEQGHMDHVVRRAIAEGITPINAIRFCTLNAALRLKRDDLGALAPGRVADVVLVDSLEELEVCDVFTSGRLVVQAGKLIRQQKSSVQPSAHFLQTVKLPEVYEDDFRVAVDALEAKEARVRVIEYDPAPGIPTDFLETVLPVQNGELVPEAYKGPKGPLCRVAVWHRHGKKSNKAIGLLAGFGVLEGAVATTVAHDSHHLVVLGVNPRDMAIAANVLRESQGGFVGVKNGNVITHLPLPLAGIMSLEEPHALAEKVKELVQVLQAEIMPGKNPLNRMILVTLPVIPRAKITDIGLVEVETQRLLPLIVETR